MKINIKLMTDNAYETLTQNLDYAYKCIQNNPNDSKWLYDIVGENPYETKKYEIEDFCLIYEEETNKDIDFANSKILYEHLSSLPRYILCDKRFWAWIAFEKAYKVALQSVKLEKKETFKRYWLFNNSRQWLMLGAISRFFFKVDVSVLEDASDKYEYTRFIYDSDYDIYRSIIDRNICMIRNVAHAFLKVTKRISEELNIRLNKNQIRIIAKEMSQLGSVVLIDMYEEDEVFNLLYDKIIIKIQ